MLRKLLYFGSNKKFIPFLSSPGYRPTRIYSNQKRHFGYKPWVYVRNFTVFYFYIIKEYRCLKNVICQIDRNVWLLLSAFQIGLRQNLSRFLS